MKARTKNQKCVVQLNKRIKPLGVRIKNWAKDSILQKRGVRYKSGTLNCFECGHRWKSESNEAWHDTIMEYICPCCKKELAIEATNKRTKNDNAYFTHVTTIAEYQLIRTFKIDVKYKVGKKPNYEIYECFRVFINEKGQGEVVGSLRGGMFYSYLGFWNGPMILRGKNTIYSKYTEQGTLYPKWKLQDFVIKRGFYYSKYQESEYIVSHVLIELLKNHKAETIWKDDRVMLFDYCIYAKNKIEKYWPTIKICIRKGYDMPSISSYFDMLNALEYFGKDLRNPRFVCPDNFFEAHDYWINKKAKREKILEDKLKHEERIAKLKANKKAGKIYNKRMEVYKDLSFVTDDIKIVPLLKIADVALAGDLMHHCIYKTDSYWKEKDNVLFGTFKDKKLIETTQFSLKEGRCKHSYGVNNKESKHHKEIVGILNNAKDTIKRLSRPKRKPKPKKELVAA
tara:strand:+ start:15301 stop:16662 length:1362 start_codon:yes stop_codon:yes gene_type:complete